MNILFQAALPLPHLLFPKISSAKQTLVGMVGIGNVLRTEIMPAEAVNEDTSFGAYANKYMDVEGWSFTEAVTELLSVFEIPLHLSLSSKYTIEDMKNAFTAFRSSEACAGIWQAHAGRCVPFDNKVVYDYCRALLQLPEVAAWDFACLFLLIFPTGNVSEG